MPTKKKKKSSEPSKSKKHLEAPGRLSLWTERRIDELLHELQTIKDCLKALNNATTIAKIYKIKV